MFTRIVEVTAKPGKAAELSRVINEETLPILEDQPGFVDEIVLVSKESPDRVVTLSFWQTPEDAEKYNREVFPRINEIVAPVMANPPRVQTFEVAASTVHDITTKRAA